MSSDSGDKGKKRARDASTEPSTPKAKPAALTSTYLPLGQDSPLDNRVGPIEEPIADSSPTTTAGWQSYAQKPGFHYIRPAASGGSPVNDSGSNVADLVSRTDGPAVNSPREAATTQPPSGIPAGSVRREPDQRLTNYLGKGDEYWRPLEFSINFARRNERKARADRALALAPRFMGVLDYEGKLNFTCRIQELAWLEKRIDLHRDALGEIFQDWTVNPDNIQFHAETTRATILRRKRDDASELALGGGEGSSSDGGGRPGGSASQAS